jgi:hypothetical protein
VGGVLSRVGGMTRLNHLSERIVPPGDGKLQLARREVGREGTQASGPGLHVPGRTDPHHVGNRVA